MQADLVVHSSFHPPAPVVSPQSKPRERDAGPRTLPPGHLDELLAANSERRLWLGFSPALEAAYRRFRQQRNRQRPWLIAAGAVIVDLFALVDRALTPEQFARSLFWRLEVFTPCALVVIYLLAARRCPKLDSYLCLSIAWVATFCVLHATTPASAIASIHQQISVVLMIAAVAMVRLRLSFSVAFSSLTIVGDWVYLQGGAWLGPAERMAMIGQVASAGVLAVLSSYSVERADRLAFLFLRREEERATELGRDMDTLAEFSSHLADLSSRDALTGLANRRSFDETLQTLWHQASQTRQPLSLVMIDIDHFKRLNDTHGHLIGDAALVAMARVLQDNVRSAHDLVGRYGGEEFVLLLPAAGEDEAIEAAQRVCAAVRSTPLALEGLVKPLAITVSCGVGTVRPAGQDPLQLVADVDAALYRAKRSGRDRVCT